jgi:hypothetical protein
MFFAFKGRCKYRPARWLSSEGIAAELRPGAKTGARICCAAVQPTFPANLGDNSAPGERPGASC